MKKPVLVVMAAGMGSRYGGLKQLVPVGENNQAIMDYSLYDAKRAGFERAVFVISEAMAKDFPADITARVNGAMDIQCVVQRVEDIPAGFSLPEGRTKPWGTAHAIRTCRGHIDAPFVAINADDYYGPHAFQAIFDFLNGRETTTPRQYAMVGYEILKTLSDDGSVARGICRMDENRHLVEIHERIHIIPSVDGPLYMDENECYHKLPVDATVSMNIWGFTADFLQEVDRRFATFLAEEMPANPLKAEYLLPEIVGQMVDAQTAKVSVLASTERWYGMTYRSELPIVKAAIEEKTKAGLYPEKLW